MWRWLSLGALLVAGCEQTPSIPGDERIGTFELTAQVMKLADGGLDPAQGDCVTRDPPITELPTADFTFEAILSRDTSDNAAWLTIGNVSRKATFDGQYVDSTFGAKRTFKNCCADKGQLTEHFRVAILSRSQTEALGWTCPSDALDGGVPGPDAGVTLPGNNGVSFDALRACGVLVDVVGPGECGCDTCSMSYPISGVRK